MLGDWVASARTQTLRSKYSQGAWVSLALGIYQESPDAQPKVIYAKADVISLVREYGSSAQRQALTSAKNFTSRSSKQQLQERAPVAWKIQVSKEIGQIVETDLKYITAGAPKWATLETHERGGLKREARSRRQWGSRSAGKKSSEPMHAITGVPLSWNRAIDALMGIDPLHARHFYKNAKKRSHDVWISIGASVAENAAARIQKKAELTRRYESDRPVAVELAPQLWDTKLGRSLANRHLSRRSDPQPI